MGTEESLGKTMERGDLNRVSGDAQEFSKEQRKRSPGNWAKRSERHSGGKPPRTFCKGSTWGLLERGRGSLQAQGLGFSTQTAP